MIRFNCHRCGLLIEAAEADVGRNADCPGCGLILVVPTATIAAPPPLPLEPAPPPAPLPPVMAADATSAASPPAVESPAAVVMQAAMPVPPANMPAPAVVSLDDLRLGISAPPPVGSMEANSPPIATASAETYSSLRKVGGWRAMKTAGPNHEISESLRRDWGFAAVGIGIVAAGLLIGVYSPSSRHSESQVADGVAGTAARNPALAPRGLDRDEARPGKPALTPSAAADKFVRGANLAAAGGDPRDDLDPLKFALGAYQRVAAGRNSRARRPQLIFDGAGNGSGLAVAAKTDDAPADAATGGDAAHDVASVKWVAADKDEPQGSGSLQVTVTRVLVGKVPTYPVGGLAELFDLTPDPYLTIWFKIKNTDAAGSVDYRGWMGAKAEEARIESLLVDDHGREHKHIKFPGDAAIRGTKPAEPISAGQSVNDALVFPLLWADVESARLTLSGKAIGQEQDLHFQLPASMIKTDNSNPLLGGGN